MLFSEYERDMKEFLSSFDVIYHLYLITVT